MKTDYTREELIKICKKAIVDVSKWDDRDTSQAQIGVGTCLAFLIAGCKFEIRTPETTTDVSTISDEETIWIEFYVKDFIWFENLYDEDDPEYKYGRKSYEYRYYLPTPKRLKSSKGKDWY